MSIYNNDKLEKQFRKFQTNRKMVNYKTIKKNPDKYPFRETYADDKVEYIFLYKEEWFIVQIFDENKETKFTVPFETMQPIEDTLESAEQILFEHIEGLD